MPGRKTLMSLAAAGAFALLAVAGGGAIADAAAQQATAQRARVVFQVSDNDPARWNLALNNVRNVQADLGAANVDIEIVSYGPGIGMLQANSPVASRIDEALVSGVKVVACENTMKGQKLARKDMLNGIDYVQAGVIELVRKQQEGWAYIRP